MYRSLHWLISSQPFNFLSCWLSLVLLGGIHALAHRCWQRAAQCRDDPIRVQRRCQCRRAGKATSYSIGMYLILLTILILVALLSSPLLSIHSVTSTHPVKDLIRGAQHFPTFPPHAFNENGSYATLFYDRTVYRQQRWRGKGLPRISSCWRQTDATNPLSFTTYVQSSYGALVLYSTQLVAQSTPNDNWAALGRRWGDVVSPIMYHMCISRDFDSAHVVIKSNVPALTWSSTPLLSPSTIMPPSSILINSFLLSVIIFIFFFLEYRVGRWAVYRAQLYRKHTDYPASFHRQRSCWYRLSVREYKGWERLW